MNGASSLRAVLIGLFCALLFFTTELYRLDRAGLYYDELHQATGSFAYLGRPVGQSRFARAPVFGVPVMNMPYSGAIKTGIYGLYLRVSGRPFSTVEWRLLGILFATCGIAAFTLLVRRVLPAPALAATLLLVLTDATLWLDVRYDWGPIALAFLMRMLFLGVWLRGWFGAVTPRSSFVLGLIVGVAIFEKLNSIVLVLPLAIMLTQAERRNASHLSLCALGLIIGMLPLIGVNLHALTTTGRDFSMSSTGWEGGDGVSVFRRLWRYLAVANGLEARLLMLEAQPPWWPRAIEVGSLGSMLLLTFAACWRDIRDRALRGSAFCLASYALVGIALHLLPRLSHAHHWIVGTPFQYTAIGLAFDAMGRRRRSDAGTRVLASGFTLLLAVATLGRLTVAASVAHSIAHDQYSIRWDPSFRTLAEFGRRQNQGEAVFLSTTWGVGPQIYCFVDGRPGVVYEMFQSGQHGEFAVPTVAEITRPPALRAVYVLTAAWWKGLPPWQRAPGVIEDMRKLPEWVETKPPRELRDLKAVDVRAFVRGAPVR